MFLEFAIVDFLKFVGDCAEIIDSPNICMCDVLDDWVANGDSVSPVF